jgi:hypothetical protein
MDHGGEYDDAMPQAIKVIDREGRSCIYVPLAQNGRVATRVLSLARRMTLTTIDLKAGGATRSKALVWLGWREIGSVMAVVAEPPNLCVSHRREIVLFRRARNLGKLRNTVRREDRTVLPGSGPPAQVAHTILLRRGGRNIDCFVSPARSQQRNMG